MRFDASFFAIAAFASALVACRAEAGVDDLVRDVPPAPNSNTGSWVKSQEARCITPAAAEQSALPPGHVVYRLPNAHDYRVEAKEGATAEDLTTELDRLSPGVDGFVNVSADGEW